MMNRPGLNGFSNNNLLLRAYQLRQDKLDSETMKDVNIGQLQESIQEAAEESNADVDIWNKEMQLSRK